jgi:hypothetical protein
MRSFGRERRKLKGKISKEEYEMKSKKYERKRVEEGDYEGAKWGEN